MKDFGVKSFWGVSSPQQALKILKTNPIDLMISDILMSKMNGYELAKIARKKYPSIAILLTTGYQTDLSRFDLKGLQCHLLHKPYHDLSDVCILLERLITGKNVYQGMDEDSFSENEDHPEITEWTL